MTIYKGYAMMYAHNYACVRRSYGLLFWQYIDIGNLFMMPKSLINMYFIIIYFIFL